MKKLLFLLLVLPFFASCSSDDNTEIIETDYFPEAPIAGVWESGNYVVSFSEDGFYSAYIADEFIDSGRYTKLDTVVSCTNTYFSRKTVYTIKRISSAKLNVNIAYLDLDGVQQTKNIEFTRSTITPTSENNPLVGKSYITQSQSFGVVTRRFVTYDSGIKSATKGNAAAYPLKFYYIYIGDKLYFQTLAETSIQIPTIGSWSTNYNTVECWKLSFSSSGSINNVEVISL